MQKMKAILEIVQGFVIILGLPLFIWQQIQVAESEKKSRTISFAASLQSGYFSESRTRVFAPLEPYLEWRDDPDYTKQLHSGIVQNVLKLNPELTDDLIQIDYFYSVLSGCVDSDACSEKVVEEVFGAFAEDVYCNYGGSFDYIEETQDILSFGISIKRWSRGQCS